MGSFEMFRFAIRCMRRGGTLNSVFVKFQVEHGENNKIIGFRRFWRTPSHCTAIAKFTGV